MRILNKIFGGSNRKETSITTTPGGSEIQPSQNQLNPKIAEFYKTQRIEALRGSLEPDLVTMLHTTRTEVSAQAAAHLQLLDNATKALPSNQHAQLVRDGAFRYSRHEHTTNTANFTLSSGDQEEEDIIDSANGKLIPYTGSRLAPYLGGNGNILLTQNHDVQEDRMVAPGTRLIADESEIHFVSQPYAQVSEHASGAVTFSPDSAADSNSTNNGATASVRGEGVAIARSVVVESSGKAVVHTKYGNSSING